MFAKKSKKSASPFQAKIPKSLVGLKNLNQSRFSEYEETKVALFL